MIASPSLIGVTKPASSTAAIAGLDEVQCAFLVQSSLCVPTVASAKNW